MVDITFSYADFEYFLLILVRVTSFIFIAPFFSMSNTPRRVRIGLGFFIALILYNIVPREPLVYETVFGYAVIVMKEVVTGILIGFGANVCITIVALAGHVADMEIGLSMVSIMDPTTRQNTSISGIYYNYMVMLMLILSGLHRYLIQALVDTYTLIPVNGAIIDKDALLNSMMQFMTDYLVIGFRICLPIFATMVLLNAVLGILAKVSPQLNMFAVGIQLKVLIGLAALFLTTGMLPSAATFIFDQMKKVTVLFVESMM